MPQCLFFLYEFLWRQQVAFSIAQMVLSGEIKQYLSLGCDHGRLENEAHLIKNLMSIDLWLFISWWASLLLCGKKHPKRILNPLSDFRHFSCFLFCFRHICCIINMILWVSEVCHALDEEIQAAKENVSDKCAEVRRGAYEAQDSFVPYRERDGTYKNLNAVKRCVQSLYARP